MIAFALANWKLIAIGALVALLGLQQIRVDHAQADAADARAALANDRTRYAQAAQAAEQAARAEESRRAESTRKVIEDANAQIQTAQGNAARADDASRQLQQRVAALIAAGRQGSGNSGAAGSGKGEQGADALDLLSGVLARIDSTAGELAAYADRLRVAGAACERYADGLQPAAP